MNKDLKSIVKDHFDKWETYVRKDEDEEIALELLERKENELTFRGGSYHFQFTIESIGNDSMIIHTYFLYGYPKNIEKRLLKDLDISVCKDRSWFVFMDKEPPFTIRSIRDFPSEYSKQLLSVL